MIHATVELLAALAGVAPATRPSGSAPGLEFAIDGCREDFAAKGALACVGYGAKRDTKDDACWPVDCPECVVKVRESMCPARWDFLETLGLAPKLEAK